MSIPIRQLHLYSNIRATIRFKVRCTFGPIIDRFSSNELLEGSSSSTSNVNLGAIPERSKDSSSSDNNTKSETEKSEDSDVFIPNVSGITKTKLKNKSSSIVRRNTGLETVTKPRDSIKAAKRKFFLQLIYRHFCSANQSESII